MLVLALDTSTEAVTVALAELSGTDRVDVLAERTEVAANRHGELLAGAVDAVLGKTGQPAGALDGLAVGLGPGPFTGLRVGIVTAKSMSDALGVPAYGECSLDVLALRHRGETGFAVMTDARRRQVYWAAYDADGGRTSGPSVAAPDDVAEELTGRVEQVCGAGALRYADRFARFEVVDRDPYPRAGDLAALVAGRVSARDAADPLVPLYLRRPDAVPPGPPKRVTPA